MNKDLQALMPELIISNGMVITVDSKFSIAEAVAVKGDRIVAVGSNADVLRLAGKDTRLIDLNRRTLLPGINDVHFHIIRAYDIKEMIDLSRDKVKSVGDVVQLVKERAKTAKPGEWIEGHNLEIGALEGYPTRWELDAVSPNNPVDLADFTFNHVHWVNSKALEAASITRDTSDPPDGTIVREPASGEPNGLILERATRLIDNAIPKYTKEQKKERLIPAMKWVNSLGYTSITEGMTGTGNPGRWRGVLDNDVISVCNELQQEGKLTLRIGFWLTFPHFSVDLNVEDLKAYLSHVATNTGFGSEWVRIAGLKIIVDGWPGFKKSLMYEDYIGGGNGKLYTRGKTYEEQYSELMKVLAYASKHRFQLGIAVGGDRAHNAVVDGLIKTLKEDPWDARHCDLYGCFITPACAKRMAQYEISSTGNTEIKFFTSHLTDEYLGEDRDGREWPLRTLLDAGVHVGLSSDCDGCYPCWQQGIETAVLRENKYTGKVSGPQERITREEAIRCYTIEGAWIEHMEHIKGSIEVGKLADFCLLGEDILTVDAHKIHQVPVVMTIVGGKTVYDNTD